MIKIIMVMFVLILINGCVDLNGDADLTREEGENLEGEIITDDELNIMEANINKLELDFGNLERDFPFLIIDCERFKGGTFKLNVNFGDFAWVQHMIASMMEETGRVGVILSSGALFRNTEKKIRQNLIGKLDCLVGVIQLGPNIFYGTVLAPCILIFKKEKSKLETYHLLKIISAKRR